MSVPGPTSSKLHVVQVPSIQSPIRKSPGFAKKELSDFALDLLALCGYGCRYCSSNTGNYLRINREPFLDLTRAQTGRAMLPTDTPTLTMVWPDVLDKLEALLDKRPSSWGAGKTLVFSMLTDGFSPHLVAQGVTRRALDLVLERTSFRVRVLTKNACVGSKDWVALWKAHPGRVVVGLSVGTLDDGWAKRVEIGTSPPSARLRSLQRLQDEGIPTFGMLCPIFPDMLFSDGLERLLEAVQPQACEHVWAEPYNDRLNWRHVQAGYDEGTLGHKFLAMCFEDHRSEAWSAYATELYTRIARVAERDGWLGRLRYLLYEGRVQPRDALHFQGLAGVLLQDKPRADGLSTNAAFAAMQRDDVDPTDARRHDPFSLTAPGMG